MGDSSQAVNKTAFIDKTITSNICETIFFILYLFALFSHISQVIFQAFNAHLCNLYIRFLILFNYYYKFNIKLSYCSRHICMFIDTFKHTIFRSLRFFVVQKSQSHFV